MEKKKGALPEKLSQFAEKLGLVESEKKQMQALEKQLADDKACNINLLEELKYKIKQLESQALKKKKEYDSTLSKDLKQIIAQEIEQIFHEIDLFNEKINMIMSNIERISKQQMKLEAEKASVFKGLEEDDIDRIAIMHEQTVEQLETIDRASLDLDKIAYKRPGKEREISEHEINQHFVNKNNGKEAISKDSLERLKMIDTDSKQ